jgi:hypothetical protein
MMDELFDGLEDAEIFQRGKYMAGGFEGVVEVKKTLVKQTRQRGPAFIVEMQVVETNMPEKHPVGGKSTWFQKLVNKDVAFPAIKAWVAACLGFEAHQKDAIDETLDAIDPETKLPMIRALIKEATNNPESNEFVGVRLRLACEQVKTKENKDFTRYDFSPVQTAA